MFAPVPATRRELVNGVWVGAHILARLLARFTKSKSYWWNNMKRAIFVTLLTLAGQCFADPLIITKPIPVNGSGSFESFFDGAGYLLAFDGSNGSDSVSFSVNFEEANLPFQSFPPPLLGDFRLRDGGFGIIDGIGSGWFSYSVGDGAGFLNLYSSPPGGILLASAPLIGYEYGSSFHSNMATDPFDIVISGTFAITSVPEPGSLALMWLTILIAGFLRNLKWTKPSLLQP
jgi:hypothetical protein